jgi:hypothetical protein
MPQKCPSFGCAREGSACQCVNPKKMARPKKNKKKRKGEKKKEWSIRANISRNPSEISAELCFSYKIIFFSWCCKPNTRQDETVLDAPDATHRWVIGGASCKAQRDSARERETHAHTRRERKREREKKREYVLSAIGLKILTSSWRWGSRDGGDFTHSGSSKTD